ncbi:hypothetical protein FA95DRAFT_94726 [Auriscalpium vulgare]|uniref:Uncharacterized protein n=1 Tax=Auriscalpium vulgare TaxID=40419 RepID=A0ACB8RP96_9AGAM|nr:hypothetical protein FA95DRAFT_94726 [Auriscalpium vulgare]
MYYIVQYWRVSAAYVAAVRACREGVRRKAEAARGRRRWPREGMRMSMCCLPLNKSLGLPATATARRSPRMPRSAGGLPERTVRAYGEAWLRGELRAIAFRVRRLPRARRFHAVTRCTDKHDTGYTGTGIPRFPAARSPLCPCSAPTHATLPAPRDAGVIRWAPPYDM